jgi:hypothetical protein
MICSFKVVTVSSFQYRVVNVCLTLKAVMTRLKPTLPVPQLSVLYLRVTKLVLVMMKPFEPTLLGV